LTLAGVLILIALKEKQDQALQNRGTETIPEVVTLSHRTKPVSVQWPVDVLPPELRDYAQGPAWRPCQVSDYLLNNKSISVKEEKKKKHKIILGSAYGRFGAFGQSQFSVFSPYDIFDKVISPLDHISQPLTYLYYAYH